MGASRAHAQTPPSPSPRPVTPATPGDGFDRGDSARAKGVARLESNLLQVSRAARNVPLVAAEAAQRSVTTVGGRVRVEIDPTDAAAAHATVNALGGTVEAEAVGIIQALVPAAALESLASGSGIAYVRSPAVPYPLAVSGEGPSATVAAAWHDAGYTGSGVKIAIIDLGFANYAARQASGDLPADAIVVDLCSNINATSHGTAVAEIVHEMAPQAQLYLITICTSTNLFQASAYAAQNGITVINHSVAWFNTSRGDGTGAAGTPDAIVAAARASGILWVNAAGNHQQQHWSGTFSDSDADGWHNFSGATEVNLLLILADQTMCTDLKWDAWPTTTQDYDLFLYRQVDNVLLTYSNTDQSLSGGLPTESLCYQNTSGSTFIGYLAIHRYSGAGSHRFDLFVRSGGALVGFITAAGSITEPASSPSAMAVGALCWQNDALEAYSSQGPTIDGRVKPDIAGQDAVSSATYGSFSSCGSSGFSGTSASAPHVAGAAALVKQAYPSYTPAQLQAFLEGRATNLGAAGKDNAYGAGKLTLGTLPSVAPTVVSTVGQGWLGPGGAIVDTAQSYTAPYDDADGGTTIAYGYLTIASSTATTAGCLARYDRGANVFQLYNGSAWTGAAAPGSSTALVGTYCTLDPSASTVTINGTRMDVVFRLSLPVGMTGAKNVYMGVTDAAGVFSGWQLRGVLTIASGLAPTVDSITPSSQTVGSNKYAEVVVVVSDPDGANTIASVVLGLPGYSCTYTYTSPSTFTTSNCETPTGSTVSSSGTQLTVRFRVRTGLSVGHTTQMTVTATDQIGLQGTLGPTGSITVSAEAAPTTVSLSPNTGSFDTGQAYDFTAVYRDVNGGLDLNQAYLAFGTSPAAVGCLVRLDQPTRTLFVGASNPVSRTLGSGSVATAGSCSLDPVNSSMSQLGNDLTVTFRITFTTTSATWNTYLIVNDLGFAASSWDNRGSITIGAPPTDPTTVSVSPSSSTVAAGTGTTLTAVYRDANGGGTFWHVYLIVADGVGGGGCYLRYDQGGNQLQILSGASWTSAGTPGSGGTTAGTNCSVTSGSSSASVSGTDLTVAYRVTFDAGFSGAHSIFLVAADATNRATYWDSQGSITVGAAATAPETVSVSPSSQTVAPSDYTTLTAVYRDANGGGTFWHAYLVVADGIGGAGCYLRYDQGSNMLQVLSSGTWTNVGAPGGGSPVAGTNCTLDSANSSASVSDTDLTVGFRVSFPAGFSGMHGIYLIAVDATNRGTYWDGRGSVTVAAAASAPTTVSVSPSSASVAADAYVTLTAVYRDANGANTIEHAYFIVADGVGGGGCYLRYTRSSGVVYAQDSGGGWTVSPGSPTVVSNCTLDWPSSSATVSGNDLTIVARLAFPGGFSGTHNIYLIALDASGLYTAWDNQGSITVGAAPTAPTTVSLTPSVAWVALDTQMDFTAVYRDVNGGSTFWKTYLVITDSIGGQGCYVRYDQAANRLEVLSTAVWTSAGTVGVGGSGAFTRGTFCTVYPGLSTATVSGTDLTVVYHIEFHRVSPSDVGLSGAQQTYLLATDATGRGTYWDAYGTFAVGSSPEAPTTSAYNGPGSVAASVATGLQGIYRDNNYRDDLWMVYLIVADTAGGGGCYLRHEVGSGRSEALVSGVWTSGATVAAEYCTLNTAASTVDSYGGSPPLYFARTFNVTFSPSFVGTHNVYLIAVDGGGLHTGWDNRGSITIT